MKRREFVAGALSLSGVGLAGCSNNRASRNVAPPPAPAAAPSVEQAAVAILDSPPPHVLAMYAPAPYEQFPLPASDVSKVPERFWRQRVEYITVREPGTLIVDTSNFFLYLVELGGTAMRYGVGLGRAGFAWSGRGVIEWKQAWPKWFPPEEMIERSPELAPYSAELGGMPAGLSNPLGARALYIFEDGVDTLYRVHGSPDNRSIGRAVSSGCVRLINQDIIDLFDRVEPGVEIVVI